MAAPEAEQPAPEAEQPAPEAEQAAPEEAQPEEQAAAEEVPEEVRPNEHDDPRLRQGSSRPDRRWDDGVQARSSKRTATSSRRAEFSVNAVSRPQARAGRETSEGRVLTKIEGDTGTIAAVGCETEPVSSNEEFRDFAQRVLDAVIAEGPDAVEALDEERVELIARSARTSRSSARPGSRPRTETSSPPTSIRRRTRSASWCEPRRPTELARLVAMHISFANPTYVSRDEVPEEAVDEERAIFEKLPEVAGKPEDVRPKIVEGMLAKRFFAETVPRIRPGSTIPTARWKALAEHGAEVREFVRYAVAESQ